jgi:hypothetical protein
MSASDKVLFLVIMAGQLGLIFTVLIRRRFFDYPAFFIYALVNLLEGIMLYFVYGRSGFDSPFAQYFASGAQALVLLSRGIAVGELCRVGLAPYRGVWALAWRLLSGVAFVLILYSAWVAEWRWRYALARAELGLEFTVAVVLTMLFAFISHYEIRIDSTTRTLAIGFFLFSYFSALNTFVLVHFFSRYADLWSALGSFAYLATLILWIRALWQVQQARVSHVPLLPAETYGRVIPEVNVRLDLLNRRLGKIFGAEAENK